MNSKLIFDIGFHKGEDTQYFLHLGYSVIGVDADPQMVQLARETFSKQVTSGQLKMLNYAVSEKDDETVDFNVSEWTLWNSLKKEIAGRDNKSMQTIQVRTRRLDSLIREFGVPYYCKIDIEGFDALAVRTISGVSELPAFISVESECVGDSEVIDDEKALETLYALRDAGYNRFKLVDQKTLQVLNHQPFYGVPPRSVQHKRTLLDKIMGRNTVPPKSISNFDRLRQKHQFNFPLSASGPFGDQLEGEWLEFSQAKEILLMHRKMFFSQTGVSAYSFWCDWHAKRV